MTARAAMNRVQGRSYLWKNQLIRARTRERSIVFATPTSVCLSLLNEGSVAVHAGQGTGCNLERASPLRGCALGQTGRQGHLEAHCGWRRACGAGGRLALPPVVLVAIE